LEKVRVDMAMMGSISGNSGMKNVISSRPSISHSHFATPFAACNFVVNWDGHDVRELLDAILCARRMGDRFIQDKLIEYILAIPVRHPRPTDIPAYAGAPVWAVDDNGMALIGMPGNETIVDAAALRNLRQTAARTASELARRVSKNGTDGYAS
jgi:hypothetical protein